MLLSIVLWAGPASPEAGPEEAYVIDRLLIGVHKDKDLESEIIEVLPTGTRLEVLKREEGVAQIRGPEGETGWVDAGYLMQEQPAAQVAEALEGRNKTLEAEIAVLKERIRTMKDGLAPAAQQGPEVSPVAPDSELMQALAEERHKTEALQAQLTAMRAAGPPVTGAAEAAQAPVNGGTARLAALSPATVVMAVALILSVGFAAGVYVADFLQRRRHGGFRV